MNTLGELKTAIADWLNREDMTDRIPDFIQMAEDVIYSGLRSRENEFVQRITPDLDAVPPVDPVNPIPLPVNYKQMKMVTVNDRPCQHISDQEFQFYRRNGNRGVEIDDARFFTIIERELWIYPWPDETPEDWSGTTLEIHYYGTESLLDVAKWSNPTNPTADPNAPLAPVYDYQSDANTTRLFQAYPMAFLHGALHFAYRFLREPEKAAEHMSDFNSALGLMRGEGNASRFSGSTVSVSQPYGDSHARRNR